MHRLALLFVCVLFFGCGDPSATAPMLCLKVERLDGRLHSIGRYRVFSTGVLSESGDRDGKGHGESRKLTIEKIADDGIAFTFVMSDRSGEDFAKESLFDTGRRSNLICRTSRDWWSIWKHPNEGYKLDAVNPACTYLSDSPNIVGRVLMRGGYVMRFLSPADMQNGFPDCKVPAPDLVRFNALVPMGTADTLLFRSPSKD